MGKKRKIAGPLRASKRKYEYFGKIHGDTVVQYVQKCADTDDPVVRLVELERRRSFHLEDTRAEIEKLIHDKVRDWDIGDYPGYVPLGPYESAMPLSWTVKWEPRVGNVVPGLGETIRAFVAALRLAEHQLLHRVRSCAVCQRWFFGIKDSALFCSTACRDKYKSSTPERRAAKAKYMREHRATLKHRAAMKKLRQSKRGGK